MYRGRSRRSVLPLRELVPWNVWLLNKLTSIYTCNVVAGGRVLGLSAPVVVELERSESQDPLRLPTMTVPQRNCLGCSVNVDSKESYKRRVMCNITGEQVRETWKEVMSARLVSHLVIH